VPGFRRQAAGLEFLGHLVPALRHGNPSLSQFTREFSNKGVVVLGISVDRDEKAYRAFLRKYTPAFLTARDLKIHEDYGTFMYPRRTSSMPRGKVSAQAGRAGRLDGRQDDVLHRFLL